MYIKSLTLKNYRNYMEQTVTFSDGLNVIYGSNASGKTNLVEAIYYSSIGKSPRTTKDKELILWGEKFAYIKINLSKKYREHIIEIYLDESNKKRIMVDKIPITKMCDLMGIINVVFFSPDEMNIIKESPQDRRRFMDISLSQQKKSYYVNLTTYNKIIAQRNKLIKTTFEKETLINTLPIWDMQMARVGTKIIKERYEFIEKLNKISKIKHSGLTNGGEQLNIEYECKLKITDTLEDDYLKILKQNYEKDIFLGYTTEGCHRDDLKITINEIDVRKYGSQGQKRTTALSMKMAEVEMFIAETGEKPILILDDVLSELDSSRQGQLIKESYGIQTLLTCTGYDGKCEKKIEIVKGKAKL